MLHLESILRPRPRTAAPRPQLLAGETAALRKVDEAPGATPALSAPLCRSTSICKVAALRAEQEAGQTAAAKQLSS